VIGADPVQAIRRLDQADRDGQAVVVLASGDPLLYGIGSALVRELGPARLRIIPGVSSVQRAWARAGEAWHDATVLSAHGRPLAPLIPRAMAGTKIAILTDEHNTPATIAAALLDAGMEDCRAVVCERLGSEAERIVDGTLGTVAARSFDPLNVMLVIRRSGAARLVFGSDESEFESVRGQITKAEVRAVALSKLRLPRDGVLWDIGAGSGSLSIEAAGLMPSGKVFAIERDPQQLACLRRNLERHHAGNVVVVEGEAPAALQSLQAPGAVFVGGTGGNLRHVVEAIPRPFVAAFAVLEHVSTVLAMAPDAECVQLAVARTRATAAGSRLAALNPVYLVSAS
ncbi:MAG: precorrin-6y C5,15-methyltransferase (decarboxylating) subunit CbiE, partial [Chloroflexi bacterium]|nr:precorrin-6y C5,15-methyltransferase (decarboxylating) subunit CbiE [Chloroflexota bacterium]